MDRKRYQLDTLATLQQFAILAREVGPHLAFSETAAREPAYADQGLALVTKLQLRHRSDAAPASHVMGAGR